MKKIPESQITTYINKEYTEMFSNIEEFVGSVAYVVQNAMEDWTTMNKEEKELLLNDIIMFLILSYKFEFLYRRLRIKDWNPEKKMFIFSFYQSDIYRLLENEKYHIDVEIFINSEGNVQKNVRNYVIDNEFVDAEDSEYKENMNIEDMIEYIGVSFGYKKVDKGNFVPEDGDDRYEALELDDESYHELYMQMCGSKDEFTDKWLKKMKKFLDTNYKGEKSDIDMILNVERRYLWSIYDREMGNTLLNVYFDELKRSITFKFGNNMNYKNCGTVSIVVTDWTYKRPTLMFYNNSIFDLSYVKKGDNIHFKKMTHAEEHWAEYCSMCYDHISEVEK